MTITLSYGQTVKPLIASECAGKTLYVDCGDVNKVAIIKEYIQGVRQNDNGECKYTSGDCFEYTTSICSGSKCSFYVPTTRTLASCQNKRVNYIQVEYYCVPAQSTSTYNICSDTNINTQSGIIQSPGYSSYQPTNGVCTTQINVPAGQSINIWLLDMNIAKRDTSESCTDYLKITDTTGEYINCGTEKVNYVENFCSKTIYISYKASPKTSIITLFKGFKLFYEFRTLSPTTNCPNGTPLPPAAETTTIYPPTTNPNKPVYPATGIYRFQACRGKYQVFTAPANYILWVEELYYRVTPTDKCDAPEDTHCTGPFVLTCNHAPTCTYSLFTDVTVYNCGNRIATYIYGVYRFIPIDSSVKFALGSTNSISADNNKNGIITSGNYPNYEQNVNSQISIISSNKVIKIYITDLNIDGSDETCERNYVQIITNVNSVSPVKYCGTMNPAKTYSFTTCSNNVQVKYVTTSSQADYSGFRMYYELLDTAPNFCTNIITTLPPSVSPTANPFNDAVVSTLPTTGGNGDNQPCNFPFVYKNIQYDRCITSNDYSGYWCSVTSNYDQNPKRGSCTTGLTNNLKFTLCKSKYMTLTCPVGYYIRIISAEAIQTTDKSCDTNKVKCTQSIDSFLKSLTKSLSSYKWFSSYIMDQCQSQPADVFILDYDCVPNDVPYVNKYEVCNGQTISDSSAIIATSNYPSAQQNINCYININPNQQQQKILNVYSLATDLQVLLPNDECQDAYMMLDKDSDYKFCGIRKPELITSKCGTSFELSYFVGSKSYKGFKIFYELKDVVNAVQCAQTATTTLDPSKTTTKPDYAVQQVASSIMSVTSCRTSERIECPADYVISVRRYFYGVSKDNKCFYTPTDCISYSDQNNKCNGQQKCTLPTSFKFLTECFSFASYLQVEYECIPAKLPTRPMCGSTFYDRNAIITSTGYPNYNPSLNCNTTIIASQNSVIKAYVLGMAINDDCTKDSLTFNEPNSMPTIFCGQVPTNLAYETCNNRLDISLLTRGVPDTELIGVSIYYEIVPKPFDFVCPPPPSTTVTSTKAPVTTSTQSTTTAPSYTGFASPTMNLIKCENTKISCPTGFNIIIRSSFLGVSGTGQCAYSKNDCFGLLTKPAADCSGKQSCSIAFVPNTDDVGECDRKKANYLYVDYQCVPIKNAGKPINPKNSVFCTSKDNYQVDSSLLIESQGYPSTYPDNRYDCVRNITTDVNANLALYLMGASFPGISNCNNSQAYVYVTDGFERFRFCGQSNLPRFVMKSRANWLQMHYVSNSSIILNFLYRGFQFYVESQKGLTPIVTRPPTGPTTTQHPWTPGFLSDEFNVQMCILESRELSCPANYMMVILKEHLISSKTQCQFDQTECTEPSSLVTTECAGKRRCNVYLPRLEISNCVSRHANGLEFNYQCVPDIPVGTTNIFTCENKVIDKVKNGFIQSSKYPSYITGQNCDWTITPPDQYGYKFYVVDMALSESCYDDLVLLDDIIMCEKETPRLIYKSIKPSTMRYKTLDKLNNSALADQLRGFRIYFEAYSLNEKTTTKLVTTATRTTPSFTKLLKSNKTSNLYIYGLIFGLSAIALVVLLMFFSYRRCNLDTSKMTIKFSSKNSEAITSENITSFANPMADRGLYDNGNLNR